MSLITLVRRTIRRAHIRMLEQDIDWARASSDAHIAGLEHRLDELRRAHWKDTTAADIARDMDKRAKGIA